MVAQDLVLVLPVKVKKPEHIFLDLPYLEGNDGEAEREPAEKLQKFLSAGLVGI